MNNYHFKTKPYAHQVKALKKLLAEPSKNVGGGLPMDMGTGKTKVAIDYACIQERLGVIDRVLVVCPLSVIGVWDLQILQHCPSGTLKWQIINYDKVWRKHYFEQLAAWIVEGKVLLVLDESHKVKNPQTKRAKGILLLSQLAQRVLWMSGTPWTKHPLDVFAPMKAIDEGILGGSWGVFKRTYAVWGGYGGYQLIKYMNLKQLRDRILPYLYAVKKEECLDLPNKTHEVVPVELKQSRRVYDKLAAESIVEFQELEVETPIVLTRLLRLSQLTGGWLVGADKQKRRVGHEKEEALRGLLEDMYESERHKVVIFVRFIDDLRTCAAVAQEAGYRVIPFYGKIKQDQRDRFICNFEETEKPTVFAAQISTGSLGISLTAASEAIFYSHSYDYAEFAQACDRLHRIGQKRPVTYYHFLARDTVDEAVWMALRAKRRIAELVLKEPELIQ